MSLARDTINDIRDVMNIVEKAGGTNIATQPMGSLTLVLWNMPGTRLRLALQTDMIHCVEDVRNHACAMMVREAGGQAVKVTDSLGVMLAWWTDPVTNSTLTLPVEAIRSADDVRRYMAKSRRSFGK